ncbi:ABC transporter permease [Nocardioides hungaricus]
MREARRSAVGSRGPASARALVRVLRDGAASLLLRPGHTVGMIAGIMLGVAGVVGVVVIADTQQAQIDRRFDLQRSDRVVVRAQTPTAAGFEPDRLALVDRLEPVSDVGEFSIWSAAEIVSRVDGRSRSSRPVIVADRGGVRATATELVAGDPDQLVTDTSRTATAWVGETLARDLGIEVGGDGTVEGQVVVKGVRFRVVGIVANDGGFGYVSSGVLISRATALSTLEGTGENVRVIAHVRPGSAQAVGAYMVPGLDPYRELMLEDVTPPDGEILMSSVGSDLRRIAAVLGGFMALIGMITVANTLLMSVYQRRRELGLRSAIGWNRRRIGLLVLAESAIAGLVAGILGVGLGLSVATAWSAVQGWSLILSPWLPFAALGGGAAASLVGGLIPALRAGSTSPMTAMRS